MKNLRFRVIFMEMLKAFFSGILILLVLFQASLVEAKFVCRELFVKEISSVPRVVVTSLEQSYQNLQRDFLTEVITIKNDIKNWPIEERQRKILLTQIDKSDRFARKVIAFANYLKATDLYSNPSLLSARLQALINSWAYFFGRQRLAMVEGSKLSGNQKHTPMLGQSIEVFRQNYDIIVRKISEPLDPNQISEVDIALGTGRIPDRRAVVTNSGEIKFSDPLETEKVFSIGFEGARRFNGSMANGGGTVRYYAVLLPKEFLKNYSVKYTTINPRRDSFYEEQALNGIVFYIKFEKSTSVDGQVHLQMGRTWENYVLRNKIVRPHEFLNDHIHFIVELDAAGSVIQAREPL
jgi:hypothetical protein